MIAILELDETQHVKSVKFATDVAEVSQKNVHILNLNEPVSSLSDDNLKKYRMLVNNPGLCIYAQHSEDDTHAVDLPSTTGVSDTDADPFARKLTAAEKENITVRPAAQRAGQTSFFGNL